MEDHHMNQMMTIRPEPDALANIEAEQQLLGAVLTTPDAYHKVSDFITADHFSDPVHQRIWNLCVSRFKTDHLVSPVALRHLMADDAGLQQLGGASYLIRLAGSAISVSAARDYGMILLDCAQRRTLLRALDEAKAGVLSGAPVEDIGGMIESATAALLTSEARKPSTSFLSAMTSAVDEMVRAYQGEDVGLMTGIADIDAVTGGFLPGDYVVLGGATSMGKTALALGIINNVAQRGYGVGIASIEMREESLAQRILSAHSRVPYSKMRSGNMSEGEMRRAVEAAQGIMDLPIEIMGPHVRDIGAIYATAKRQKALLDRTAPKKFGLLVIDYIQLVRGPGRSQIERMQEVSPAIKALAKLLGVPVIALGQIGRNVGERDDKRPHITDLSDSSQIEKDADTIILAHREHYYLEREGAPRGKDGKVKTEALVDHEAALKATWTQMDALIRKNRAGAIRDVKIGCDVSTNRFWSLGETEEMEFGG
jgi:replicative DNA helicase